MRKPLLFVKKSLLALLIAFSAGASAQSVQVVQPTAEFSQFVTQRQTVDLLLSEALQAFRSPARVSNAGFTGKLPSNMEIVVDRLLKAYELEPYRADLLFSAASAYIYNKQVDEAIKLYQKILTLAPEDIDAHSYLAAWYRYKGEPQGAQQHLGILKKLDSGRAERLSQVFAAIDRVSHMPIHDALPEHILASLKGNTAIVTLGYALNPDGSMHAVLIERLNKTLELAKQLPEALIVVTGGVPQNNKLEAKQMAEWLVEHGIEKERIYQDNFARSTVENALYSRYALAKHKINNMVLISSGSHVRRGEALFEIATHDTGPRALTITSVAALDKPLAELQKITDSDLQGIYRDALKTMGLWSFRSYPLEER